MTVGGRSDRLGPNKNSGEIKSKMAPDNSSATLLQNPKVVGVSGHYSSNFVIIQQSCIEYYESLDLGILPRMFLTYRRRTLTGSFNSVGLFT